MRTVLHELRQLAFLAIFTALVLGYVVLCMEIGQTRQDDYYREHPRTQQTRSMEP